MKSTATANANIALVKYWGKRDSRLILPQNGSISMTCDGLQTTTTVEFGKYKDDKIILNDEELKKEKDAIVSHLNLVREMAGIKQKAKVVSRSNFPVAAGLASSASGFAALSLAASCAAGLSLNEKELSILARRGSGSASRSICEGFVEWFRGSRNDGSDSYAQSIAGKEHWHEFRMFTTIVTEARKKVSSRAGMSKSVETCPYYKGWLETIEQDLNIVRKGIKEKDFSTVGHAAEHNCLKMHALMLTTIPSIIYWQPATMEIIHEVMLMRQQGLECYFTIDAGPNVKVMCLQKNEKEIVVRLKKLKCVKKIIACRPGEGARLTERHLF